MSHLLIQPDFPSDTRKAEPEGVRELQATCRRRVQSESQLCRPPNAPQLLEASVLKLRDNSTRLRRGVTLRTFGVAALLGLLTVLVQGEQLNTVIDLNQKVEQALERLAEVESHERQPGEKLSPEEQRARAYPILEKDLGLEAGLLARELPAFAQKLYNRSDTSPLMRAKAAYALNKFEEAEKLSVEAAYERNKFEEAEKLSLEAANQDRRAHENAKTFADKSHKIANQVLELAGQLADKRIQYEDAPKYHWEAEQLADRVRDPLEWAKQQWKIASVLEDQGQYAKEETVLRGALEEYRRARGDENKNVLALRMNLALALLNQGKSAEAEMEYRAVLKLQEKVLGPEHRDTLGSRNNLALALAAQGKSAEAETEDRTVLQLRGKVLGPEHPDTLTSRNNLANVLSDQCKDAEAETEYREVVKLRGKVLGPEHPDTLTSRNNLANVLFDQCKYAEADTEYREVVKLREKVFDPEVLDTLENRNNLACELLFQGKYAESEAEIRAVIKLEEKVLGAEHCSTLASRILLASALHAQGNYAEAEMEYREVIKLEEKVLGPGDADTLKSQDLLNSVLCHEGKYVEAVEIQQKVVASIQAKAGSEEGKRRELAEAYISLSWYQVLAKDFVSALASTDAGRKLDASFLSIDVNRAHALLFLGRIQEAEQIYLKHRDEKIEDGRPWISVILQDFADLEKAGLASAEFLRIRKLYKMKTQPEQQN